MIKFKYFLSYPNIGYPLCYYLKNHIVIRAKLFIFKIRIN